MVKLETEKGQANIVPCEKSVPLQCCLSSKC